jgi:endonuclease NucS-like protein
VYKPVQLESEAQLEDLLFGDPSVVEDGMKVLGRQWHTDRGPLDLLLLDRDGRVVVAELKLDEDDDMLMQGVDYVGWVHENLEAVRRAFEKDFAVATDKPPRLILIARAFSDLLRRVRRTCGRTCSLRCSPTRPSSIGGTA